MLIGAVAAVALLVGLIVGFAAGTIFGQRGIIDDMNSTLDRVEAGRRLRTSAGAGPATRP